MMFWLPFSSSHTFSFVHVRFSANHTQLLNRYYHTWINTLNCESVLFSCSSNVRTSIRPTRSCIDVLTQWSPASGCASPPCGARMFLKSTSERKMHTEAVTY